MNKEKLRVYGLTTYDRSAKVRWLLTELGVDFDFRLLDRAKKEHESPDFLRINPMGRIPVLEFDNQVMFESGAICAYLADRFIEKGMATTLDSKDRSKYLQWMYFASATLDVYQIRIMVIEDIPPGDVQTTKQSALQSDVRDAMEAIDQVVQKSSFLVGDRFTAADICVSYHLAWLLLWPELEVVMKDFPKVMDYIERMKNQASAVKADIFSYKG